MSKMNDTIYRQAARSAICDACGQIDCDKMDVCKKLDLPSAQPEEPSYDAVKDYCQKRCLSIVDTALLERLVAKYASMMQDIAQPNRGHWQKDPDRDGYGRYICSECKEPFEVEERMGKPLWKFCPMCGARMEAQNE